MKRDWIFTFGQNQHDGAHRNHFVRVHGTFEEARLEMFRRYGRAWAMQYPNEKEAGSNLTEIPHFETALR